MVRKRAQHILLATAVVLVAITGVCAWYVSDYYHASPEALVVMADADGDADGVVVRELSDKAVAFMSSEPSAGLVFYPGAKVQPESYAPLARECAERGILFVVAKPPFNLAILDEGCVDGVIEQFPEVDTWAVGGHSMGGVAACDYALRHDDEFSLVVLLASYPAADLKEFDCRTLSIVGSNDTVLNWENYEDAQEMLPAEAQEVVLDGGIHAYFGDYGAQAGDGVANISRKEQQEQTADAIAAALASL